MKQKLTFLLLAVVFICYDGCKSKRNSNKIILNLSMGMNLEKLNEVLDSLITVKKIEFEGGKNYFTYDFILPDGSIAETRCTPTVSNGFLNILKIEFGHPGGYDYSGTYKELFYNFENMNKVENVFQQYVNKYGTPETKKGRFKGFYETPKEFDAFYWQEDNYNIVFFKGEPQYNKEYESTTNYSASIEYTLNESEKEKLTRQKSLENNDL